MALYNQLLECLRTLDKSDSLHKRLKDADPWFDLEYRERYQAGEFKIAHG